MVDVREEIYALLQEACGEKQVYSFYPAQDAAYPCVSYYEAVNTVYARADGQEHLTEIVYAVDIWGKSVLDNDQIAAQIDAAFAAIGWKRTSRTDLKDPACYHKAMKYRAVLDDDYNVYQA